MPGCCGCFGKKKGPRTKVTLVIVGLDNAGKTTAIMGIQGEDVEDVTPTVGFSSVEMKFDEYDITIFDLGGGKKIRGIWKNYYAEVHGVIFVIDATAEDRLKECQQELDSVLQEEKIKGKRILILANKQDQEGALDEIDICDQLDLEEMVNRSKCPCRVETCSAVQGIGKKVDKCLQDGFRWLLRGITEDWEELGERVERDTAELKEQQTKARKARIERARKAREEREKKEEEERIARGEDEVDGNGEEPGEENINNPWQKVDQEYFDKKEDESKKTGNKKKKKKKKGKANGIVLSENGSHAVDAPDTANTNSQTYVNNAYDNEDSKKLDGGNEVKMNGNHDVNERLNNSHEEERSFQSNIHMDSNGRGLPDGIHEELSSQTSADPSESGKERKKKKGKKFKKKNKVGQVPADSIDEVAAPPLPTPLSTPSWAAPPGHRNLFKASQQPGLETLVEHNSPRSDFLPPISSGAHDKPNGLPDLRQRSRPNVDEEDVVT